MSKPIVVAITVLLLGACASQSSPTQSTPSLSNDCQKMAEKIKSSTTANTTKSTLNAYYNKHCK
ncbi:MAG: hypothetical protein BM565_09085 [Gammaproteobacteria bacterium MedPE]|nr:MAG: hypothetical protein BM565_09085 [Gammaproteobacteria bacterium MedPE]